MATKTLSNTALDIPAWQALLAQAREPLPRDWLRWCMDELELGWLAPARVAPVLAVLAGCTVQGRRLVWHGQDLTPSERSQAIQGAALRLHELGLIKGWRGEAFACERPVADPERQRGETLFEMERAAFRFFGLQSRAAHVNGYTPDGRLWCGRRAPTKATDPGLLDNLAAGGLPAGEALLLCAQRELGEEAGVPPELARGLRDLGALHTRRRVPEGWHDEVLQVFNLTLPAGFVPRNQDGEVSEFLCLEAGAALARCQADEFTRDAAVVTAFGLLSGLPG